MAGDRPFFSLRLYYCCILAQKDAAFQATSTRARRESGSIEQMVRSQSIGVSSVRAVLVSHEKTKRSSWLSKPFYERERCFSVSV